MLNQLAKKIKAHNPIYYKNIVVSNNELRVSAKSFASGRHHIFYEALGIQKLIDESIYNYIYDDDNDSLTITLKENSP